MSRADDLLRLSRALKDAEVKARTLQTNLDAVLKELNTLRQVEDSLLENIKCLKENKITVVAKEFKKAKEELKKTLARQGMLANDKAHFSKVLQDLHKDSQQIKLDIQKLETEEDNVLSFKGKKNG